MWVTILTKKGISLVEVLIAMFLTTIAAISILPMHDMSIRTAGRSDFLGRAVGIMQEELEMREQQIMAGTVPGSPINQTRTVSGLGSDTSGDVTYNVLTTTTLNSAAPALSWLVRVQVTWPGNANGIRSSIIVTSQSAFMPTTGGAGVGG